METRRIPASLALIFFLLVAGTEKVVPGDLGFGIGIKSGVSYLEGDYSDPQISPIVSGHLRIIPFPYFAVGGELSFAPMKSDDFPSRTSSIVPFEVSGIFNFLPFRRLNPYVMVGGGGVYWKTTSSGTTLEDNLDSFLKTGGGLEYKLNERFSLDLGATYRFSFTDAFDQ